MTDKNKNMEYEDMEDIKNVEQVDNIQDIKDDEIMTVFEVAGYLKWQDILKSVK